MVAPIHTYDQPGIYTVTFGVLDSFGQFSEVSLDVRHLEYTFVRLILQDVAIGRVTGVTSLLDGRLAALLDSD